jgi:hypothetical protein
MKSKTQIKLSGLLKRATSNSQTVTAPVAYSWHKKGNKSLQGKYALAVFFTTDMLSEVRYRDGDRMEVVFSGDTVEFNLASTNPFSIYKSNGRKYMMKVSTAGIEDAMTILPNTGKAEPLPVIRTATGQIFCQLPETQTP